MQSISIGNGIDTRGNTFLLQYWLYCHWVLQYFCARLGVYWLLQCNLLVLLTSLLVDMYTKYTVSILYVAKWI